MKTLGIVGTGLIGASIGLRARAGSTTVIGSDTSRAALDAAMVRGAIDGIVSLDEICTRADCVIVAAPIRACIEVVRELARRQIGAQLVIANGSAWSARYRGTKQVTVCFLGDGATNIGAFHEALNLAAVWQLPVIFICENNQYMEYTAIGTVTAVPRPAADRAAPYGLEPVVIDGNDVEAVYRTAQAAIARARDGGGPSLIEALTYRHGGHSRADPGKYRPAEEVKEWLARDPLPAYRRVLLGRGVDEATLDAIEKHARDAVDRATEEAKAGAEPGLELAETNVWADGGHSWRN